MPDSEITIKITAEIITKDCSYFGIDKKLIGYQTLDAKSWGKLTKTKQSVISIRLSKRSTTIENGNNPMTFRQVVGLDQIRKRKNHPCGLSDAAKNFCFGMK